MADVIELTSEPEAPVDSDYMSDSEGGTTVQCNGKLATVVRKKLAVSIQNLMQHGLMSVSLSLLRLSLLLLSTYCSFTYFPTHLISSVLLPYLYDRDCSRLRVLYNHLQYSLNKSIDFSLSPGMLKNRSGTLS